MKTEDGQVSGLTFVSVYEAVIDVFLEYVWPFLRAVIKVAISIVLLPLFVALFIVLLSLGIFWMVATIPLFVAGVIDNPVSPLEFAHEVCSVALEWWREL